MIDSQNLPLPDEDWTLIIQPQRHLLDLRLGELWRYRDLVLLFVRRDFVATYKQTILGPLWYLIHPLLTTTTFTFIFGRIAELPTDGLRRFPQKPPSRISTSRAPGLFPDTATAPASPAALPVSAR